MCPAAAGAEGAEVRIAPAALRIGGAACGYAIGEASAVRRRIR